MRLQNHVQNEGKEADPVHRALKPVYMFRCGDVVVDDMGKNGYYYYHIHYMVITRVLKHIANK